jgi:predicted aspartyl protease
MIARLLLFLIAILSAGPAVAACELRQRADVTLEAAGALMLAPVNVNGIPGLFILDTGAAQTVVTPEAVDRFNLALDEWTATTMRGVGGVERRRNADPRTVELGGVALHRRSVARDATLRVANLKLSVVGGQRVDGLLGRDFLSAFDLDLDFSQRKLRLYEVHGCTGRFLPWTELYSSIPVQNPTESAILVPAELDGVRLHALLDSGASETLVAAPGMARLGLGLDRLRDDPHPITSGVGPHSVTMWHHRFETLQVGDEAAASPVLLVAPIQLNPTSDMLLGADWLLGRRAWISYTTNQLFVRHDR